MPTFSIENAKSGRASCKKCKEKIAKGELRLGVSSPGPGDFDMTSWYHPKCYNIGPKLRKEGVTPESLVSELLQDNTDELNLRDIAEDIIEAIASKVVKSTTNTEGDGSSAQSKIAKIKGDLEKIRKRKAAESSDESEDELPAAKKKKRKKKSKSNDADMTDVEIGVAQAYAIFATKKNDELKDILRWNRQMVSGSKDILLQRCIDGHMNGRLAVCPSCSGRLKLKDEDGETILCNGTFDEESMVRQQCFFTCKRADAPRLQPWFTEEPSEEEKEEMEEAMKGASAGKNEDALSSIVSLTKKMKWDLSEPSKIKKTAQNLLDICIESGKIDLPRDPKAARMAIGKILLQNKSAARKEICQLIVDQIGVKKSKAEEDSKQESMASLCKHPSNGPIMEAMLELGTLYFAEGNRNAGATYNKVANAVKELNVEITEENAKGLGKGKTKVANIGKGSAEKMYEFVTTGTMEKLEEKRANKG